VSFARESVVSDVVGLTCIEVFSRFSIAETMR
jgi:hypothetical protein